MANKKTLVLGASENTSRYGNMALRRLRASGHDVVIHKSKPEEEGINTVTMYMNEQNQKEYEDYILSLNPKRIIFNPGAENYTLAHKAEQQGIQTIEACTLVMLSTGQY